MKSLYRKYRPLKLSDVVGQEQVTEPLGNALKQGKVSHAYLLIGPRGTGKTTVARIFAHEVNKFDYQLEDDYVDIIEIDGASNRGVDNIREIREKAMIAPSVGKYKVYIIDEVHMLTKEAFNALLKTLEEPPEHVIFIMATTDAYKVPITITSRAQTYTFKLAPEEKIFQHLKTISEKEKIAIDDEALKIVVKKGGGSFRDSLSLLDQVSTISEKKITKEILEKAFGLPQDEIIQDLLNASSCGDTAKITAFLKDLYSQGIKAETIAEELIRAIVAEPKRELLFLLESLPDVKAPFADARLLVAMLEPARIQPASRPTQAAGANVQASRPAQTAPRTSNVTSEPAKNQVGAASSSVDNSQKSNNTSQIEQTTQPQDKSSSTDFDWQGFLEKIKATNDVISTQLKGARWEISGSKLVICPEKSFAKVILKKPSNLRILCDVAGREVLIDEIKDSEEDALKTKISGIIGGEVQIYGGGNPFE